MKTAESTVARRRWRRIASAIAVAMISLGSAAPARAEERLVFEDPGRIQVVEGEHCAYSFGRKKASFDSAIQRSPLLPFEHSRTLPRWADEAAVLMNGWKARYLDRDHHVALVGGKIHSIEHHGTTLSWKAGVTLQDDNWDDSIEGCYYFTVVAWRSDAIDARRVPKERIEVIAKGARSLAYELRTIGFDDGSGAPVQSPDYAAGERVAVLPMGSSFEFPDWKDHHILQVGYALGQDADLANEGENAQWLAYGLFNDDRLRSFDLNGKLSQQWGPYYGKDEPYVGVLVGTEVRVVGDSFRPKRKEPCGGFLSSCIGSADASRAVRTERVRLEGLGYPYVIPMLTGFDLSYEYNDEQVTQMGAWIHDIDFDPATGDLEYSVSTVLLDKNSSPGFDSRTNVVLLALGAERAKLSAPKPPAAPTLASTYEPFTDRPGRDYRSFDLAAAKPLLCRSTCLKEDRCSAWTYVKPGVQGPKARCWLKHSVPGARLSQIGVSGVKYSIEPKIDRPGGDYRSFFLPRNASPDDCRVSCMKEARCRAWTFVEPGVQGSRARCWLKSRVPASRSHSKTTSGVVG